MECGICSKDVASHDDFLCVGCICNSVYLSRLELARTLLENEQFNQQISKIVEPDPTDEQQDEIAIHAEQTWKQEILSAEMMTVEARVQETRAQLMATKDDVERLKTEIAEKKKRLLSRKSALTTVNHTIPDRRQANVDTLSEMRDKGMTSFGNVSAKSASARAFLCRETAALLRLRQRKRQKNGRVVEQYTITGLLLPDLKEINNLKCSNLTASLTITAHLLVLVAFYLGIRLPAEITIPHRDYPLPTINTPANSYVGHKIAFPGSGSISTAPSSPFSSKLDVKGPYRPRPLFLGSDDSEERVAQFAKRDPTAFNFFIEGISLLAMNIAWLSRSQGFSHGTNTWEDICDIGRNLHQLILGQAQSPALLRILSNREAQRRRRQSSGSSSPSSDGNVVSFAKLGQTSHLSAHSFLGQASFSEQTRSWKYGQYNTISDPLKKTLLTEMNNAEWELLQEQEYLDGGEQFDEAVFIRARHAEGASRDAGDVRSIMTARTHVDEDNAQQQQQQKALAAVTVAAADARDQNKPKGTSGWTKVKSRNEN